MVYPQEGLSTRHRRLAETKPDLRVKYKGSMSVTTAPLVNIIGPMPR